MIQLKTEIKEYAVKNGFVSCGVARVDDFPEYKAALDKLINNFPETESLYSLMYNRTLLKERFPWAKSIVVCLRDYGKYHIPLQAKGHIARNYLFDSRVPQSPDYLMVKNFSEWLKNKGLKIRKGGVPDRLVAYKTGLVSIGKNSFAYAKRCGSWINIVTYLVGAELEPDTPVVKSPCPPGCTKCIDACPTGAIVKPYTVRMDRCIAYLTYGAPLPINNKLEEKMGNWIYGCDICQEVCPLNKNSITEKEKIDYLEAIAHLLTPAALARMDKKTYQEILHPLFYYISPDNIDRWHRNADRVLKLSSE
ncbi:MAG: epoxyqueuosine reductase [Candidatus Ratteibacteria bacterium]